MTVSHIKKSSYATFNSNNPTSRKSKHRVLWPWLLSFAAVLLIAPAVLGQQAGANGEKDFYTQVRAFSLGGGSATVSGLALNRDRVQLTFTGNLLLCHAH